MPSTSSGPTTPARLGRFGQLILVAAVAGALVAGLAIPLVGSLGLVTKSATDTFQDLPTALTVPPLAQKSRILAADGSTLATFYYQNRTSVPLSKVAPVMRTAIVSIEDSRFYEHHGIDIRGIVRAAVTNHSAGTVQQGGSTLTQQYVKNVLLNAAKTKAQQHAANADTVTRKLREARYALALEQRWSKDQILQGYLNIAYFGSGAYGIDAAARHYFGVPPGKLRLGQAAMLAGLVRNPYGYNPLLHPQAARERRDTVLDRMAQLGKISNALAARAEAVPVRLHVTQPGNGCIGTRAPFFCDYVVGQLTDDKALGGTAAAREATLLRGGLTIRTTLSPRVQRDAMKAVLSKTDYRDHVAAVADVVKPGTGAVQAMAVNRIYDNKKKRGHTTVNLTTGGTQGVQGGSTFKIFTLTAALEEGIPLDTSLSCPSTYTSAVFGGYTVSNAEDSEGGTFNLVTATANSVNTCFVKLEEMTGTAEPVHLAKSMGVRNVNGSPLNTGGSFTLGTDSISPLAMAAVYATYANHGRYCPPRAITSITDAAGHPVAFAKPSCRRVMPRAIADTVASVLTSVIQYGTGTGAAIGRPAAGKTGTAQGSSAAWFDGFVPQLAAAVWLGDPRGGFQHPLVGVRIGGVDYGTIFGGTISAPIWGKLMRLALKNTKVEPIADVDATVAAGRQVTVPSVDGLSVAAAMARLKAAGLSGVLATYKVRQGGIDGTVAYASPGSGSTIGYGSTVTLVMTNGKDPEPTAPPTTAPAPSPSSASPAPSPTHSSPKPSHTPRPHRTRHHPHH